MDPDYFRKRINTSLTGGLSLGYQFTDKYRLLAQASFQKNLTPINNQTNPVEQHNTSIGLGIGLEMQLDRR